jgi:hypothetical protein
MPPTRQDVAMRYEQNLFISYAHLDDDPLTPGEQGWITRFHGTLGVFLGQYLGRKATIWRDEKLQGNDVFGDEIVAQFKQSAVLVSVLTPRYLNSEWCTRESREFCAAAQQRGGLLVGNKSRVFKVIKTPVDAQASLPAAMQDLLGYEFFAVEDGAPLELDPAFGDDYAKRYNRKVAKLAWDVKELIKGLEAEQAASGDADADRAPAAPSAAVPGKPAIYLAECSYDRKQAREVVEGELSRLGYPVLPDQRLPADEAEYVAAVQGMLARCALAIHLVGESYGAVPDGPTAKSAAVHQNDLAVARCRSGALARLIWLPQGTRSQQPAQQAFIDALHQDAQAQFGADLLTGDLEQFKAAIHTTLKQLEQPEPRKPDVEATGDAGEAGGGARVVYLICNERDLKATVPLRKLFRQAGIEVTRPVFEGDAAQVRKANQALLASCDGVLLFYGAGDEGWKRSIDGELKKMAGYRAGKPLLARCTYLAEPGTADKQDMIEMEEPGLIDGLAGLAEAALAEFMQTMQAAGKAA